MPAWLQHQRASGMSTFAPDLQATPPPSSKRGRRSSPWTWRWGDRLILLCAWVAGIGLCLLAAAIVIYMGYRGIQYLRPSLLFTRPAISTSQSQSGGILDPLIGTVPTHMREVAFALGKTRIATIRRVLLPSVRSNIATGVTLGISRIIGDTAIVVLLLGKTLHIETQGSVPGLSLLRGTGSSLTSYVYDNSPAGEGAAPQKAYAAAFVLLLLVLGLNLLVDRIGRSNAQSTGMSVGGGVV